MDQTYNGWTNYATWRVNLEIFDDMDIIDVLGNHEDVHELAEAMKDYAIEVIDSQAPDGGLAYDYAMAFLSNVNWYEIANWHTVSEGYFEEATK